MSKAVKKSIPDIKYSLTIFDILCVLLFLYDW